MTIAITSAIKSTSEQWAVSVTLTTYTVIADPAGYISGSAAVQQEIISRAGLDADVVYIAVALVSSSAVGSKYVYALTVTFGDALTAGGHTHGCDTVTYPLQCGYDVGPSIALSTTLGPVIFSRPSSLDMDFLQLRYGSTDLFKVGSAAVRLGNHTEFYPDATYDFGTPDAGVTLRRPRDVRISRDIYAGGNIRSGGFGIFADYCRAKYDVLAPQAVNPSTDASVRHIYVNSVDNSLRWWDGTVEHIIGTSSGSDTVGLWNCDAGVQIRDVVFCDGADHVNRANATTLAGRGIAGICVSKPTGTTAMIRYSGEISGYGGLVSGSAYFVSTSSGLMTDSPGSLGVGNTLVQVGIAKNTTTLAYQPTGASII